MSILSRKQDITVRDHVANSLLPIYRFDPLPDFIRISREGLLTSTELQRLKVEDHFLLTAQQIENLNWLWTRGKIVNLPKSLDSEEASNRLGYWFGFTLPLIFNELYGGETAMKKADIALKASLLYLEELSKNNGLPLDQAYKATAPLFAQRVLGDGSLSDETYREKHFYVSFFGEQILKQSEKEFRNLASIVKIIYEPPS